MLRALPTEIKRHTPHSQSSEWETNRGVVTTGWRKKITCHWIHIFASFMSTPILCNEDKLCGLSSPVSWFCFGAPLQRDENKSRVLTHTFTFMFPMRLGFWASDLDPDRFFRYWLANRNSLPRRKSQIYCEFKNSSKRRDQRLLGRRETRWVRCAARRNQVSERRLTASGLAAKRRGECARVNLSSYFEFHHVTDCCCCCTAVQSTSTYPRRGCRVRFSWSLSPSPRRPAVFWPRRDAPPADCASGAKQRRYTCCVTIQLIDRSAAVCCRR